MKFAVSEIKLITSELSFLIESPLSKSALVSRLKKHVSPNHTLFFDAENKFEGEVYESGFKIRQSVGYMYSLLPVFHGHFEGRNHNVFLRIKASNLLTAFVVLWGWAWSIGLVYAGVARVFRHASEPGSAVGFILGGIFAAIITIFTATFYHRKIRDGKDALLSILTTAKNAESTTAHTTTEEVPH